MNSEAAKQLGTIIFDLGDRSNVLGRIDFGLNAQFEKLASTIGFPMDQGAYQFNITFFLKKNSPYSSEIHHPSCFDVSSGRIASPHPQRSSETCC